MSDKVRVLRGGAIIGNETRKEGDIVEWRGGAVRDAFVREGVVEIIEEKAAKGKPTKWGGGDDDTDK